MCLKSLYLWIENQICFMGFSVCWIWDFIFRMETRSVTCKHSSLPAYGGIISPVTRFFFLLIYMQYSFYLCIFCCLPKFAEINQHSQPWENSASVLIHNQAMPLILSTDFFGLVWEKNQTAAGQFSLFGFNSKTICATTSIWLSLIMIVRSDIC